MKRRTLSFLAVIVTLTLIAGCGGGNSGTDAETGVQNINSRQLQAMLADSQPILLADVRTEGEHNAGRIPGSEHLPLDEIATWSQTLDPTVRICCICQSGDRSLQAAGILVLQGFEDVYNLSGGMNDWDGQVVTAASGAAKRPSQTR